MPPNLLQRDPVAPALAQVELSELLDIGALQTMMDDYYALTKIGVGIIDLKGEVLVGTGWQDICVNFHRAVPESCAFCRESDTSLSRGVPPGTFREYRCKNNMWDIATPIMLGERHVGNIFLGQFLYDDEEPDYELFRAQARRFGYDEATYLAALERVPRWSRQTVRTAMNFYAKLARMISEANYGSVVLADTLARREEAAQELRRAKAAAEAASVAKSHFLATMSHEIRSPMNGVIGMLELLKHSELSACQREYVEIAIKSGFDLVHLLNDLLDLSKIEADRLELELLPFDLRALLTDTIAPLALQAQAKGVALSATLADGVPVALCGDAGRLRQLVVNIVGNALKFTLRGSVELRVLQQHTNGRCVVLRFEVSDSGIGIPVDKIEQIFEPFTQVDSSITRKFGGTGLGLAISKQLVELMGGRIGAESCEGRGSTFWFTVVLEQLHEDGSGPEAREPRR